MIDNVNVLVETQDLSHDEWLQWRCRGLGGSDIAAVLGLSKWMSATELWLIKTGQKKPDSEPNEAMIWGTKIEPLLRQHFTELTGKPVVEIHAILQHPKYSFCLADLDGLTVSDTGEPAILELKTCSAYKQNLWADGGIPIEYQCQIQHYLMVTGLSKAYCMVLLGGNHIELREVDADLQTQAMLLQAEKEFWLHVQEGSKPPVDGSDAAKELLDDLFKGGIEEEIILPESAIEFMDMYLQASSDAEDAKERMQTASNHIKDFMKDYNKARCLQHSISWKPVSSERLDSKLLKAEMPEVYAKYAKTTTSRRFQIR